MSNTSEADEALPSATHPALAQALAAQGYSQLTPVQSLMLDPAHAERDLLVSARTGSGKTVAFGIAIASTLLGEAERFADAQSPLGLVIAPTRELALQVQRELNWLYAAAGIRTATAVGGIDMRKERRALEGGAHLVVGTPGRLRDHITKGVLDCSALRAVVLDEADEMLDLGFREDLEFILAAAPQTRRTLLFSATVPRSIADLARTYQRDAVRVVAGEAREQHSDIEYRLMLVRRDERDAAVINTLLHEDARSALVFCHTREAVRHLAARLSNRGFAVVALSGEMAQGERTGALQAMRDGRARVCVATDVAARGIDLPNLDLVIHADVPSNPATLLHRSGRTGRAGRKGVCVLVVPEHRRGAASRVLGLARLQASVVAVPALEAIETAQRERIVEKATAAAPPDENEARFAADLAGRLSAEALALAFLRGELAALPVAEDVNPIAIGETTARLGRGDKRERPERDSAPREERISGGILFSLSLGRKQRADPKWLLPMICKAGGVGKRDVGAIRIGDTETVFEIAADKAQAYAERIQEPGALERGIMIAPAGEGMPAAAPRPKKPHRGQGPKPGGFAKPAKGKFVKGGPAKRKPKRAE
ncbi:MAG: helicase [Mesorhizobium amorphae]|nr:MAG: helicase [Mesorhizobium amorphae]